MILVGDFGGTSIKLGLVEDGRLVARDRLPVDASESMEFHLRAAAQRWETLLATAHGGGAFPSDQCQGIALGLPFLIDRDSGRVSGNFHKFPGAETIDFHSWLMSRLGAPGRIENDVRLALLGEALGGAGRGMKDVVLLALGTGVGCAVLSGGALVKGAHDRATILAGHSTVDWKGQPGRCGTPGCVEDLASTATLSERLRRSEGGSGSSLKRESSLNFAAVVDHAAAGDWVARTLIEESLDVWSALVINTILAYDPALVILSGGILGSADLVLGGIRERVNHRLPDCVPRIPIVASTLGDDAALIGGASLFNPNPSPP